MKRAINCVKVGLSHLLVGVAPGGLHHKLTGECHSSKSVRACTEKGSILPWSVRIWSPPLVNWAS